MVCIVCIQIERFEPLSDENILCNFSVRVLLPGGRVAFEYFSDVKHTFNLLWPYSVTVYRVGKIARRNCFFPVGGNKRTHNKEHQDVTSCICQMSP